MESLARNRWVMLGLGASAILIAIFAGVALRLDDPLSSPVVPAEDPYTHMALVREHVRDGSLDPLNDGALYPPGMHAFIATAWIYTGADLYEIIRLGPVVFGGLAVLGFGLLLWRTMGPVAGPIAGFVGALAFAVAPELVFRTTMMAPTAMDMAVLPFLIFTLLEIAKGRLGWLGVAAPVSLFVVFAHPWLYLVLGLAGAIFAVLALLLRWSSDVASPLSARGLIALVAVAGLSIFLADATAGSFRGTLNVPEVVPFGALIWTVGIIGLLAAVAVAAIPTRVDGLMPRWVRRPAAMWARIVMSVVLLAGLIGITMAAVAQGMPDQVDLPRMFGWPILLLAGAGLVAMPFIQRPVAYMGAAIAMATYPFVIFNPLESPFWSHRTAAFLGVGLVILVGVAAGALFRLVVHAVSTRMARPKPEGQARTSPLASLFAIAVPGVLLVLVLGGGVYAGTPETYPEGWYRMYEECELDAFRDIAAQLGPDAILMTGTWQSKLVVAALATDTSRIWYNPAMFNDPGYREDTMWTIGKKEGRPILVLVDRYLPSEHPEAPTGWLHDSPWHVQQSYCQGLGGFDRASLTLYRFEPQELSA